MKIESSPQIFEKTNIKFHENPSGGSLVVPCGWTDGQRETTKLVDHHIDMEVKNTTIFM
jgi:hypothetical protein